MALGDVCVVCTANGGVVLPAAQDPISSVSFFVLFQPLNEQISRLHEELAAERLSREVMDERKTKEIKTVESTISLDLTQEKRVSG